ncbi:hypothetical protein ACQKWADRAFT_292434 [Trichoderma austrokoningii]
MLDHMHGRLRITSWDENIGKHSVVIACPVSMSRAGNDAKVLADMMSVFSSIKVCLIVGTSTGVSPRVGSGDVVVSRAENRDSALLAALAKLEAAPAAAELYTKMLYHVNFAEIQICRPGHLFKSPPHEDLGIFNGSLDESSKAAKRALKVHYGLVHENAYHTARANIPCVDGEAARLVTNSAASSSGAFTMREGHRKKSNMPRLQRRHTPRHLSRHYQWMMSVGWRPSKTCPGSVMPR